MPYRLAGEADQLIALRCFHHTPLQGGVIGVTLKKRLAWRTIIQTQAEYLLHSNKSLVPFCMVSCLYWMVRMCTSKQP